MPFQFSLATVLRVRLLREEREERLLQKIFQEIARTRHSIDRIHSEIVQMGAGRVAQISSVLAACDLQLHASAVTALHEYKRELEGQLERLEQLKESQLLIYQSARRDRETVSDLRVKGRMTYNASLAAREQKALDDNFNSRRHRASNPLQ